MKYRADHVLPFGGADMKQIAQASRVPTAPTDPTIKARIEWLAQRSERIAQAKAARPQPAGTLYGSRYSGGCVGTSAAR